MNIGEMFNKAVRKHVYAKLENNNLPINEMTTSLSRAIPIIASTIPTISSFGNALQVVKTVIKEQ